MIWGLDPGGLLELDAYAGAGFGARSRRRAASPEVETRLAARTPQTVRTLSV